MDQQDPPSQQQASPPIVRELSQEQANRVFDILGWGLVLLGAALMGLAALKYRAAFDAHPATGLFPMAVLWSIGTVLLVFGVAVKTRDRSVARMQVVIGPSAKATSTKSGRGFWSGFRGRNLSAAAGGSSRTHSQLPRLIALGGGLLQAAAIVHLYRRGEAIWELLPAAFCALFVISMGLWLRPRPRVPGRVIE